MRTAAKRSTLIFPPRSASRAAEGSADEERNGAGGGFRAETEGREMHKAPEDPAAVEPFAGEQIDGREEERDAAEVLSPGDPCREECAEDPRRRTCQMNRRFLPVPGPREIECQPQPPDHAGSPPARDAKKPRRRNVSRLVQEDRRRKRR